MPRKTSPPPPTLEEILRVLGENIKLARLRRRITASILAERAGMTRVTLRKIENGDSGVTMGAYAMVLFCLSLEKDLLLLAQDDTLGRKLLDAGLTQPKQRVSRQRKHSPEQ